METHNLMDVVVALHYEEMRVRRDFRKLSDEVRMKLQCTCDDATAAINEAAELVLSLIEEISNE